MPKPFLSLLSSSSGLLLSIFELPEDPVLGTGLVALTSLAELRVRHGCGAGGLALSHLSLLVSSLAIQRCCQATLVPKSGIGSNPLCSGWLGDQRGGHARWPLAPRMWTDPLLPSRLASSWPSRVSATVSVLWVSSPEWPGLWVRAPLSTPHPKSSAHFSMHGATPRLFELPLITWQANVAAHKRRSAARQRQMRWKPACSVLLPRAPRPPLPTRRLLFSD